MPDHQLTLSNLILQELQQYWYSRRRGHVAPARSDIDPGDISAVLDHAFILERIAPGAARFRLAGRHLVDLMKMEVRGMPLCALFNTGHRGRVSDVLESMFRTPQIARLQLCARAEANRPALRAQMLLLPLRSDLGDVTRALGGMVTESQIGPEMRRFDIIGEAFTSLRPGIRAIIPSPSRLESDGTAGPWHDQGRGGAGNDGDGEEGAGAARRQTPQERRARFRVIAENPASQPSEARFPETQPDETQPEQ